MKKGLRMKRIHRGRTFEIVFYRCPCRISGTRLQIGGSWHWSLFIRYENGGGTEIDHGMVDGIFPIGKMRRVLRYRAIYWSHILEKREAYV